MVVTREGSLCNGYSAGKEMRWAAFQGFFFLSRCMFLELHLWKNDSFKNWILIHFKIKHKNWKNFCLVLLQVLSWSNFFVPDQKFTYCGSHKNFVPDKKMICIQFMFMCQHKSFLRGTKCSQIFGLTQKIWTSTKFFETCKRTRHSFYFWLSF